MEGKLLKFPMNRTKQSERQQFMAILSQCKEAQEAKLRYNEAMLARIVGLSPKDVLKIRKDRE